MEAAPSRFVAPFGRNTPGPKTQLSSEHENVSYSLTYEIIQPSVRSESLYFLPIPEKDVAPVAGFGELEGQADFLKLLKYLVPYPSAPLDPTNPERLGGDKGLGGPMGPMSPGMLSSSYGTILVSGPMDSSMKPVPISIKRKA